jgi:hypothetical protein
VSIVRTNQPISNDERALRKMALGKKVYETTRYVLVGNRKQGFAILEVRKEVSRKTFQKIVDVNILALANESIFIADSDLDVLNPNQLIPFALRTFEKTGKRAVVVQGKYGHVNFAVIRREPRLDKIVAVDVVPPEPGKLISMIREAMKVGLLDRAVEIELSEIDLIELARKTKDKGAEVVIFPCESSGITPQLVGAEVLFLDRDLLPMLKEYEKFGLVGCDVSLEALHHLLGRNLDESKIIFEQMCPKKVVSEKRPFITKCCKLRQGYEPVIENGKLGVIVPWGARTREIADALNWLLDAMARKKFTGFDVTICRSM